MNGCRTDDPTLHPDPKDGKIAAMLSGLKLQANLYQWRFNMKTGEVREGDLDDYNAEFPMIAVSMLGKRNRYAYLQHIPYEIPATFHSLVKYDVESGSHEQWDYGEGVFGSEAPFCPRPGATSEDDGYLVTFVTDTKDWSSSCQIFDAQTLTDGPIATIHLPQRLPAGFHATWVPREEMG
jgi:carotenoid cleavage dioxygenase